MAPTERDGKEPRDAIHQEGAEATSTTPRLPVAGDLVIRNEEGKYFWLKKTEYEAHKISPDSPQIGQVSKQMELLTQKGVLLADVPKGWLIGIGLYCKLINLSGIRCASPKRLERSMTPEKPNPYIL